MSYKYLIIYVCLLLFVFCPQSVFAKCGGVDYSWGADALATMHDYIVTMMLYVLFLRFGVIQGHTKLNIQILAIPYK